MKYDFLILGAGLSGLENACLLAQKGLSVCVVEQNPLPGGCLQPFRRGPYVFDTGFHYVGGLQPGGSLHALFQALDLLDLPWVPLDPGGFDRAYWEEGHSFAYPTGFEAFTDRLLQALPGASSRTVTGLNRYVSLLQEVGTALTRSLTAKDKAQPLDVGPYYATGAYSYLLEHVQDPQAIELLSGNAFTMELHPTALPLYPFAQINSSFLQGAYRLRGGAKVLIQKLLDGIRAHGGCVLPAHPVRRLLERNGLFIGADVGSGVIEARQCISTLHPAQTFRLLQDPHSAAKPLLRRRMERLANTYGMFTLHLGLKAETLPYFNHNLFLHKSGKIWSQALGPCPPEDRSMMICCQPPLDPASPYTREVSLLMPMFWEEVAPWAGTLPGARGEAYLDLKARFAQVCLQRATRLLPGLGPAIDRSFSSTPLTYLHYTAAEQGAAYGVRKDCLHPLFTVLPSQTPLPNLHLCSHHLSLHGLLGVSVTTHRLHRQLGL